MALIHRGMQRHATGFAQGGPIEPLHATSAAAPTRLRLATLNIHSCVGMDNRYDPKRTADVLKGYDLISLHEVRGALPWGQGNADVLGGLLDQRSLFAPSETWFWRPWFGDAVLSSCRIDHWERTPLPGAGPDAAFRQALQLQVPFGSGTLNVIVTHLGKNANRLLQFGILSDRFLELPTPAVMMGDMNTRPYDPVMRRLIEEQRVEDPVGQRLTYTRDRVDFILLRGVKWRDAGLVETRASDHPVIWVEIEAQ